MIGPESARRILSFRRLQARWLLTCRRLSIVPASQALLVSVRRQQMWCLHTRLTGRRPTISKYVLVRAFIISTSRFGVGQVAHTNRTPLGLHRIAAKIGTGWPVGTVFVNRKVTGFTWQGLPNAAIAHRILWLEGLEQGFNLGGNHDTFNRYIYIHGVGDETTIGRPASRGCIHMKAQDIMWLFDRINCGSMVWIDAD